jgi:transposase
MQNFIIIGTDVSKLTLDHGLHTAMAHHKTTNNEKGFEDWLRWALGFGSKEQLWIILEHTGYYSYQFEIFLHQHQIRYTKVAALEIKRSVGLVRGKSDKVDALFISRYGWMNRDRLAPQELSAAIITELKDLVNLRDKLVRDRSGYKARMKEQAATRKYGKTHIQNKIQTRMIKELTQDIKQVEAAIKELIKADAALLNNYKLLVSIKAIGFVTAVYMLAYTENFCKFLNSRKFACYAGLAPFEHTSGTSLRGKNRVSHYANKKAKCLLNLAASVAIQHNPEMKAYYQRRVAEGKSKMGVLNIIRNKLVDRMFAVIKRGTGYQEVLNIAA